MACFQVWPVAGFLSSIVAKGIPLIDNTISTVPESAELQAT
jgi:hypothetical protein